METYTILLILSLVIAGLFFIVYTGVLLNNNNNNDISFFPFLIGTLLIGGAFEIACDKMEEVSIKRFVNNELKYDTVLIDKNGKLVEIKVTKNKEE